MAVNKRRPQASREVHHPVHIADLDLPTIIVNDSMGYKPFEFQGRLKGVCEKKVSTRPNNGHLSDLLKIGEENGVASD